MKTLVKKEDSKLCKNKKGNKGSIKYIKDKSLKKFLLQHMKRQKLDFSKIKIPSFFGNSEEDEEDSLNESFQSFSSLPTFNLKKFFYFEIKITL